MRLINEEINSLTKKANYITAEFLTDPLYKQDPEMVGYLEARRAQLWQRVEDLKNLKAHYNKTFVQFP